MGLKASLMPYQLVKAHITPLQILPVLIAGINLEGIGAMKFYLIPFLLLSGYCAAQGWQAEIIAGTSGYHGDLTQNLISLKTLKPAAGVNLKYNIDNTIVLRGGIAWINVEGNDRYNKQADLKSRNLNFKSSLLEASFCAEINLVEPELFYAYPYIFGGLGLMRFNPYTYDKDNLKTYLQPLGTEGQGLPAFPGKKAYSLTQICLPVGGGWKINLNKRYDIIYEFGYRFLFTDYLDDVSTTYVNPQILLTGKGAKTVELAYRQNPIPDGNLPNTGDTRGNPKVNDAYFFSGIKLLVHLRAENKKLDY